MRRGFSLLEIVLVLAVAGLISGIALPRLSRVLDVIRIDSAAHRVVAAHQRARLLASARNQVLVLSVEPEQLAIRIRGEAIPLWSEAGPSALHVTLAGPPRQFTFSPDGLTLGLSNATLRLTRGGSQRSVVVSRLGRVRIVH